MTKQIENRPRKLQIAPLVVAADVVHLTDSAILEDPQHRLTVVGDVQPIPHVEPVTVKRHLLTVEHICDEEGYDLLRMLVRSEVV